MAHVLILEENICLYSEFPCLNIYWHVKFIKEPFLTYFVHCVSLNSKANMSMPPSPGLRKQSFAKCMSNHLHGTSLCTFYCLASMVLYLI